MPTITNVKLTDLPVLSSARGLSAVDYFDVSYYDTSLSAYFSCKMPPSEIVKYLNKTYGLSGLSDVSFTALSSGDVLKYNGTKFVNLPDEGVGIHNLHDPIHNVQVSTLANNDVLAYDSAALKWKNKNFTSTPHNLNSGAHTDILAGSPTYGQAPVWNGSKFEFMNVGGQYGMGFDAVYIFGSAKTTDLYISSVATLADVSHKLIKVESNSTGVTSADTVYSALFPLLVGSNIQKTEIGIDYHQFNNGTTIDENFAKTKILIDWITGKVTGAATFVRGSTSDTSIDLYFNGNTGSLITPSTINGAASVKSTGIETNSLKQITKLPLFDSDDNEVFEITIKNYKTVALSPEVDTVYIKGWFDGESTSLSSLTTIIDSTRPAWCSLSASQKFSTDLNGMFPLTISDNVTKTEIECFATGDSKRFDNIDDEEAGKLNVTIDWNNSSVNGVYNFMDRIGQDFSCGGILSGTTTAPIFVGINNKGEADTRHSGANENYSASVPELQIIGRTITKLPKIKHTSNLSYTIRNYKTSSTDLAQVGTKYDTGWMVGYDTGYSPAVGSCQFSWENTTYATFGQTKTNPADGTYGFYLPLPNFPTSFNPDMLYTIYLRYNGHYIGNNGLVAGDIINLSSTVGYYFSNISTGVVLGYYSGAYKLAIQSIQALTLGPSIHHFYIDAAGDSFIRGDLRIVAKTI